MADIRLKKLQEQRDALNARIKREHGKLKGKERRSDTRRKILMGAWAFEKAQKDNDFSTVAMKELDAFLVRDLDRALFGLKPLKAKPAEAHGDEARKVETAA